MECIHQCRRRLDRISLAGHGVTVVRPSVEDVQHALVNSAFTFAFPCSDTFYCCIILYNVLVCRFIPVVCVFCDTVVNELQAEQIFDKKLYDYIFLPLNRAVKNN